MQNILKRRRIEGKTDYKARISLLKSRKPRVVFRKTNRYIIASYVKSEEAKDKVIIGLTSKELLDYGWDKKSMNIKNMAACYLTGYLLGKKIIDKEEKGCIFDIGMARSIKKSRVYAFLKGVIDAGVSIKADKDIFPDEKRIKEKCEFEKIKEKINKKFV